MSTSSRPLAALAVLLALICSCSTSTGEAQPSSDPAKPTPTSAHAHPPALPAAPSTDPVEASFAALAAQIPGHVGVAISDGQSTTTFGDWQTGPAWSTIKVPLSIAALRADPTTAGPLMIRAITQSDNAAADQMWALLGEPAAAAAAVHQVLAEGLNRDVVVQAEQIRPPYSPYGQTVWSQADAAHFAWALPCIADAEPVLTQMHNITADQRWGMATNTEVGTKGGWGPDPDGTYLARQIAVVHTESGSRGVALAAKPDDGSFTTATMILNMLADWITQHDHELPSRECSAQ